MPKTIKSIPNRDIAAETWHEPYHKLSFCGLKSPLNGPIFSFIRPLWSIKTNILKWNETEYGFGVCQYR